MFGDIYKMELQKTINDPSKSYSDKVDALLCGWKRICTLLSKTTIRPSENVVEYLHQNTVQYLLKGEWTQLEDALRIRFTVVLHNLMALSKTDLQALKKFKLLIKLVHEPWQNATLHKILHSLSPTDNEVREYVSTEGVELLILRLEILCKGKCEDLACKLASTVLKHLYEHKAFKKQDVDHVNDVLLMLLFKFKKNQEIIDKLKKLDLMEGLDLVKRFGKRKSNDIGVWKFCDKVTEIAAHTVLASVIVQSVETKEKQDLFYELVNEWATIHVPKLSKCISPFCNMVRKIVQKAESPIHVYIFAQVLHKQLGDQIKPLCIELYIRGFTSNINLIENFKLGDDNEKTIKAEILLSNSFLELSELLEDNIIIHRECVLTSFSLHPTEDCLKRLENAASLRCKNCRKEEILQKSESDKLDVWNNCDNISCVHAREKTEDNFIDAVNSLNILNSDLLGLAPHLCDDLSTVLCSPRCQTLSWSLGWSHLRKQCGKYLAEHSTRQSQKTELKFLNIDFTQFVTETETKPKAKIKPPRKRSTSRRKRKRKPKVIRKVVTTSGLNTDQLKSADPKPVGLESADPEPTEPKSPIKKVPFRNYSNIHKKEKNTLNNSMMKMQEILSRNYNINALSEDANDGTDAYGNKLFQSTKEDSAISFFTEPYSLKSRSSRLTNIKYTPFFECSEGSVFSCSTTSSYEDCIQSPKPAEVPPVTLTDPAFHEQFVPLFETVTSGHPKPYLTEIFSRHVKSSTKYEYINKTEFSERFKKVNVLPKHLLKHDKLLAKSVPGMNSLDLIVPSRPEPTVQVVQIPSSNSVLQPVSSNAPSTIQTNSTTITIAKPLTESISTQSTDIVTHSQAQLMRVGETNHDSANNSNLLLTTVLNQGGLSRIHNPDQRNTTVLTSSISSNRTQGKPCDSNSSERININSEPIISLGNVSTNDGSTQVTAHIQRVGQPHKQKFIYDETTSKSTSTQNSNVHLPGTIQIFEESAKHPQPSSVSSSVYRFILKDGKILEQYCPVNQNSTYSLPDILNDGNLQGASLQESTVKPSKKKKEPVKDDRNNSENISIPSLPQFHQAFRRQVYQSGSIIEGNTIATSPSARQYPEENVESHKQECISAPLSKAVQTVLKDAETSTKSSERMNEDSLSSGSSAADLKEEIQESEIQSQSGVIFSCKVPISLPGNNMIQTKPVTIIKSNTPQDILRRSPQKIDSENINKDSVIRSNMNALLAAALQSSPIKTSPAETCNSSIIHCMKQGKVTTHVPTQVTTQVGTQVPTQEKSDSLSMGTNKHRMPSPTPKNMRRQNLVQPTNVSRFNRPPGHSAGNVTNQNAPPVVTIPLPSRNVQTLPPNVNQNSLTDLPKVDNRREHLPQNSEQSSVSSTTLEQLREFESVLEQVTNTSQMKERGHAKKPEILVPTTSSNSEFPNASSTKGNTLFQNSLVSTISELSNENRVSLTFISKATTTCTNTIISGTSPPKMAATTPVVVVQSCNRTLASPALSIASQNSPGSSPSTSPANSQNSKINPKLPKPKSKSIGGKTTPTATLKVSTIPKPQQKPQEDEQTTQRIYAILDKYAEQLRNSPELKNKPAPRRRSNPPTNPSQNTKRKKSSQTKSKGFSGIPSCSGMEMSPCSEDLRTGGSEDSSNGVCQVTQTGNSPHSRSEEHSNQGGDTSSDLGESLDKDPLMQHRILLADQSGGSSRTVIVQDNVQPVISVEGTKVIAGKQLVVGGNATVPLTLQLPGTGNVKQVLFPVPTDGRPFVVAKVPKMYRFHQVTMPSGSPLIATNSSGTVLLRQMCLNKSSSPLKQVKVPVVSQISTHMASHPTVVLPSGPPSFTLSAGSSIDSETLGITLDNNTILLNSSSAPASSIGFIQRNVSKSSQSPNVLPQNRQMCTQETNTSSPESDILSSIKTERTVIKCEQDTSRSSEPCDIEIKTEDIKYSIDSNCPLHEASLKGATLITSSTNNNWVQVLKDSNSGSSILNKVPEGEQGEKNSPQKDPLEKGVCIQEVVVKEEECEGTSPHNPLSQSQGLKRKVENTIFQIAFKRDKMKATKDEFMQQRNTCPFERELRLQSSLSEECEDLGVDKPSTSDLFPEAELLLDPDPLSRDSLQGESFPRGDSSSSSAGSPNHSPLFGNKCSNSWTKHKRTMIRHKYTYGRSLSPIKRPVLEKTDPSRECTAYNANLSSSKNSQIDVKDPENNFKCISKNSISLNECDLQGSDLTIECNDSNPCNFSDVDENNDTDILDTEGDSDNDFLQKSRQRKHSCNSLVKKDSEPNVSSEPSLLRRFSSNPFNKCDFYTSKESPEKRNSETSPWYQVMKGIQKDVDPETERSNLDCRDESQNGILEDFDDDHPSDNFVSNKIHQARKRKTVGLFMTSPSEDSGSSIDTLLAGSDMCSADFHDTLTKRASPRGLAVKGCPCINGSPEPNKKKKDLSFLDKTEKPCSTKSSFSFSNKKPVSKSNVKLVNRKR